MKHLFIAALIAAIYCVSAIAETKVISVKLANPIAIGTTKSVEASFESLDPQADAAFRRAAFVGQVSYEKLSNGETRVVINWDAVKDGSKSASVEPFITRAATSDQSIPAGTLLKARGDTALLTAAIRNMKENGAKTAAAGNGVVTGAAAQSSALNTYSSAASTTPRSTYSGGSGSSGNLIYTPGYSGSSGDGNNNGGNNNGGSDSSGGSSGSSGSAAACKPIVDLQAGTYTITERDGDSCKPTAAVSTIYETAQGCPQITDYDNNIVKIATRKYALPSAAETQVTPCAQTGKTAALLETYNGCQWVADMDREVAVLQKRYYFTFANEPVYVTSCVNSDKTAPLQQYKGDLGCQPIIDEQAGTYQETASDKGLCKPIGSIMKIYYDEEQCEPFVDWTNGSVTLARIPYVNKATGKEFVGSCERSDTTLALQSTTDGCAAVLDKKNERAIEQIRWYYDLGSAPKYLTGCQNSDNSSPIVTYREYNGVCKNLINVAALSVTPNYRTMTRLGDRTLEVKGCQYDNNVTLEPTYEGCAQRHDFMTNKTFEQERLFYLWDGERNYVTSCRDSAIAYSHYLTTATCQYQNANGKVIVNKRIAYNQSDGTVGYATNCKPVSDELLIEQEFCGYEHDFVVNQSYRQERDYFSEPITGERVYLTNCARTNINFPHREETNGWIHDDSNLRSKLKVRKYFVDTTISDTHKVYPNGLDFVEGLPVPYANKGMITRLKQDFGVIKDRSIRFSNNIYTWDSKTLNVSFPTPAESTLYIGYGDNLCGYTLNNSFNPTSKCKSYEVGLGSFCTSGIISGSLEGSCYVGIYTAHIVEQQNIIDYLRADGSTYSVELDSWYQVQP
jgi:hypothetical protein